MSMRRWIPGKVDRKATKIAMVYALVTWIWIVFLDQLLLVFVKDPHLVLQLSAIYESLFIFVSASLLALLLRRNITTLARRTEELEVANQELEAFSYSVSHDLRSPLTRISGFSDLILSSCGHKLDAAGRLHLQKIYDGTQDMDRIITALFTMSRFAKCEMARERVNLSDMVRVIAGELQLFQPERSCTFRVAGDVYAFGDPRMLRVLLENLLGNAWKYTRTRETAVIEFDETLVNGESAYFVRDNGVGFDMRQRDRMFEAFQRLHSSDEYEGFGIGLATVNRIVKRHEGHVWAEGKVGQGATFSFTLPRKAPTSAEEKGKVLAGSFWSYLCD
jgi:light-regulated signal transduction histidine kinase (bacteriophytochrome)